MGIKLYGVGISIYTRKVLACLYEKEVEFEFVDVDVFKSKEHKNEFFLARNPFGQVPVMEVDGDITLFESRAMTQFLAHNFMDQGTQFIFLHDKKKMAEMAPWIEVESTKFSPIAAKLGFECLFKSMYGLGSEIDEDVVSQLEEELCKLLDVYEVRLSKCKYLSGDDFGLADLHHMPEFENIMKIGSKKIVEARPNVSKWVATILARPSWAKVLAMQN